MERDGSQRAQLAPARAVAVGQLAPPASGAVAGHQISVSRRTLVIAAAALVLVLAMAGGGIATYAQSQAPAGTGQQFCDDLRAHDYARAYQLLSAGMRAHVTPTQFATAATTLDQVEGKITGCAADPSGYSHGPFDKTATATYIVTREHAGPSEGNVHLVSEAGGWRVDGIDAALLGASLEAVQAVNAYCAALTGQRYADAYALLGEQLQTATKQADYVQVAQWHDQLDGQLIVCTLSGLGASQSNAAAGFTLTVTRTIHGVLQGALALAQEGGAWRIISTAASLQGTEIAPLQTALRFCGDLSSGSYADIYAMVTKAYLNGESQAQLAADLSGKASGVKWASCTLLDLSGYKLGATKAYVNIEYQAQQVGTGYSWKPQGTLEFVKQGDAWLLNSRQGLH